MAIIVHLFVKFKMKDLYVGSCGPNRFAITVRGKSGKEIYLWPSWSSCPRTARHGSHQPITLAATEPLHTFYTYRHIPTLKSRTRVRFISVPRVMKATSPLLSSPSTFTFTPIRRIYISASSSTLFPSSLVPIPWRLPAPTMVSSPPLPSSAACAVTMACRASCSGATSAAFVHSTGTTINQYSDR